MPPKPLATGVSNRLPDTAAMLQLELERIVTAYDDGSAPPQHFQWTVQPSDAQPPPGFTDCGRFDRFRLFTRIDRTAAHEPQPAGPALRR